MMNKTNKDVADASKNDRRRALWLVVGLVCLVASGCEKSSPEVATPQAPVNSVPSAGSAVAENPNADRYALGSPNEAIKVGEQGSVAVTIDAADGLKVNEEFPWSIRFEDSEGVKIAQKEFKKGQINLEKHRASIPLTVSVSAPGTHQLNAVGDFSVCNDTQCYVIRNQKLAFNIEASAGEQTPPAAAN